MERNGMSAALATHVLHDLILNCTSHIVTMITIASQKCGNDHVEMCDGQTPLQ